MSKLGWTKGETLLMTFIAYLVVASVVFQLRHPWATETECLYYLPKALMFGSVSYDEARQRYR